MLEHVHISIFPGSNTRTATAGEARIAFSAITCPSPADLDGRVHGAPA